MAVIAGGTSTCDTSTAKFLSPAALGLPDRHRVGRRGRLEADREEDDVRPDSARRSDRQSSGE